MRYVTLVFLLLPPLSFAQEISVDWIPETLRKDWPCWRGPTCNSIAPCQSAPLHWGPTKNILWKTAIPGKGYSSPIIVENRIFLTTADEQQKKQMVLAFARDNGKLLWKKVLFHGGLDRKGAKRNSQATPSVACDGERVFATFLNRSAIWVTALDLDGKILWQKKIGPYVSFWGYAPSPALYKSSLLIAADHSKGGYLLSLDRKSGKIHWKQDRPRLRNYTSPIVHHVAGRDQLLITGCKLFAGYDPDSGKLLWKTKATTMECCGTVVTDGNLVFASGGYPKKETVAIKPDGSGKIVWKNNIQVYASSLLVHDGYIYAGNDSGFIYCWRSKDGKEMWRARTDGIFKASCVLVSNLIYLSRQDGTTFIFRPNPEQFELVAQNKLGDEAYATPTICGGRIFIRVAHGFGRNRQEMLYCVGEDS